MSQSISMQVCQAGHAGLHELRLAAVRTWAT
jgi:hypothetical protein